MLQIYPVPLFASNHSSRPPFASPFQPISRAEPRVPGATGRVLSKCWEEAAQDGEGAAGPACTRLSTGDSAIPRSPEQSQRLEPSSRKHRACVDCTSYRLLLTPTVSVPAALSHGGLWAGVARSCHCSCGLLQGPAGFWQLRGSVPVVGAVRSDSEDVAVALVGRTGEEKGGES